MALSKAELELHASEYQRVMHYAREMLAAGNFRIAVEAAVGACHFVDGMMRYEKKYYGSSFDRIEGIDIVLVYAPLIFHSSSLEDLDDLLKSKKQIDKNASADLAADLVAARERMISRTSTATMANRLQPVPAIND